MARYECFLHVDLLDRVPKTGEVRSQIFKFIAGLRNQPQTPGDFTERDASQRDREVKIIGDYAITYWVDHPVKTVLVVDIRRADT